MKVFTDRLGCSTEAGSSREFPLVLLPLPDMGIRRPSRRRKTCLLSGKLYRNLAEEERTTELLENITYAALGVSGLAGVVVAFL
jgi:hypothetical protein